MIDAQHVLLDDRPGVEFGGHVMTGRADDFHAAIVGRVIGPGSGEGRQKRMMDVDDAVRELRDKLTGEDLHIACQHDEIDLEIAHQCDLRGFLLRLVVARHGEDVKIQPELAHDVAEIFVIADDCRDLDTPFPRPPT